MAWESRHYASGGDGFDGGGDGPLGRVAALLNKSFPIGTYLDVAVRVHITFLLLAVIEVVRDLSAASWAMRWLALLFLSVLLHEFGHCLACRRVGGSANAILMWPLGGLAYTSPPHRPWAHFVTVIWGPLVNIIIAAACYVTLLLWMGSDIPVSLHPLNMWRGFAPGVAGLVADLFVVNYALTLFNLCLLFYPFDGGRIVQAILWAKLDYRRSMMIATRVGMVGAVLVGLYGLAMFQFLLIFIAVFGFITCYQQGRMIRRGEFDDGLTFDPGYYNHRDDEKPVKPGMAARWREARRRRDAERDAKDRAMVDAILDKVRREGLGSLTRAEKRTLERETQRQRRE